MYVYPNLHQISSFHHPGSPTGLFAFARTTSSSTTWAPLRCTECVMAMDLLDTWCPSAWCRPCRFISAKVTGAVWSWRCLMFQFSKMGWQRFSLSNNLLFSFCFSHFLTSFGTQDYPSGWTLRWALWQELGGGPEGSLSKGARGSGGVL